MALKLLSSPSIVSFPRPQRDHVHIVLVHHHAETTQHLSPKSQACIPGHELEPLSLHTPPEASLEPVFGLSCTWPTSLLGPRHTEQRWGGRVGQDGLPAKPNARAVSVGLFM